jgi:hypothetical protein
MRWSIIDKRMIIMKTIVAWLERELEGLKRDLTEAEARYKHCQELLEKAKAKAAKKEDDDYIANQTEIRQIRVRKPSGVTMVDQMKEILKTHGPLPAREVFEILQLMEGREQTTYNSVNNLLYKHRGEKFIKNEDGRWNIVSQYQNE